MKTKKTFISIFTLCIALLLTACSPKEAPEASDTQLDDLYQQENQLFADHDDEWNKVFGMMNKNTADSSGNYADYLADTIESNKTSFTDDELKILADDIETIRKIEEQIAEIETGNTASDNSDPKNDSKDESPFKNFSGQDFDGNSVDESLFSELNELNDTLQSMGGEVIGINTETFDGNEAAIKEAAAILESQKAEYRNLSVNSASDAGKYASGIMAFPTTILVDRNGNIVGDPVLGGIDNQDNYDALMDQIQSVIDADSANK